MPNKILQKSKIVYERLFHEYADWENIDSFMQEFGLGRQSFYDRKNKKKIDYDEIARVFPEVNREWLFSNDPKDLKILSVRKNNTIKQPDLTHKINALGLKIDDEGVNYEAQKKLFEYLESRIIFLSQELADLSRLIRQLGDSMNDRAE